MTYPKVCIIILNYNGWGDTIECLESVLRNDYPNYQVIVVDNNSPNNSMEYIKAWAEGNLNVWVRPDNPLRHLSYPPVKKPIPYVYYNREEAENGGNQELEESLKTKLPDGITTKYPLIFIQTGENLGFAGGNNIGIRYALAKSDFEYVCLLNNDTVVEKDFLVKLVEAFKFDENAGIVGGKILYYDNPDIIWYEGGKLDLFRGSGYHFRESLPDDFDSSLKEVTFVTGCLMLIRKEVFHKVGLMREEYFLYVEDPDFCYRTLKQGFKMYVNLASKIYHKVSVSTKNSDGVSPLQVYYLTRNKLYFMLKIQESKFNKLIFLGFFTITRTIRILEWLLKGKLENIMPLIKAIKDFRQL